MWRCSCCALLVHVIHHRYCGWCYDGLVSITADTEQNVVVWLLIVPVMQLPDELQPLLFFQYLNLLFLSPHRFMVVFLSIFYSYCRIMFMIRKLSAIYQLRLARFRWGRQKSPTLSQVCLFLRQRFYMSLHKTWVRKSVAIVMKK